MLARMVVLVMLLGVAVAACGANVTVVPADGASGGDDGGGGAAGAGGTTATAGGDCVGCAEALKTGIDFPNKCPGSQALKETFLQCICDNCPKCPWCDGDDPQECSKCETPCEEEYAACMADL